MTNLFINVVVVLFAVWFAVAAIYFLLPIVVGGNTGSKKSRCRYGIR